MSVRLVKLNPVEDIDAEVEAFEQGTGHKLYEAVHGPGDLSEEFWSPAYDFIVSNVSAFGDAEWEARQIMKHYEDRLLELVPETEREAAELILSKMDNFRISMASTEALFCTVVARSIHNPAYLDTVKAKLEQ